MYHIEQSDADTLGHIAKVLQPYKEVVISSERKCTISLVEPMVKSLLEALTDGEDYEVPAIVKSLKSTIKADLQKR